VSRGATLESDKGSSDNLRLRRAAKNCLRHLDAVQYGDCCVSGDYERHGARPKYSRKNMGTRGVWTRDYFDIKRNQNPCETEKVGVDGTNAKKCLVSFFPQ